MSDERIKYKAEKEKITKILKPIKPIDEKTKADKSFLFSAKRSTAGRDLPEYYLIYFLFVKLLNYKNLGQFEKVSWSVPIDYNEKAFLLEHRKFGMGLFVQDLDKDEDDAVIIVRKIKSAIKIAEPFFDEIANEAIKKSLLNVNNKCPELYERYCYLVELYDEHLIKDDIKDKSIKELIDRKVGNVEYKNFNIFSSLQKAKWIAISAIEAFFSWTEHLFIHLAIINHNLNNGEEIANLSMDEWSTKFKKGIGLDSKEAIKFYNELLLIRRQLRNFVAHGAFGKNGEAFKFHSGAGAVPVLMPYRKGKNRFSLVGELSFDEKEVLSVLNEFIEWLWHDEYKTTMLYLMEGGLPTILTMVRDGAYSNAIKSEEDMKEFIDCLNHEFDRAANMDW